MNPGRISRRARAAFRVLQAIESPSPKAARVVEKASDQAILDGATLYGLRQGWLTLEPAPFRPAPSAPEPPPEPAPARWRAMDTLDLGPPEPIQPPSPAHSGWPQWENRYHGHRLDGWTAEEVNPTFEPWDEDGERYLQ